MRRLAHCILFCFGAVAVVSDGVEAQAPAATRGSQFLFVIDDSGSMAREVGGLPAADPDRLAVFAVRSLVAMLDDADEVAMVRLNGPLEGEEAELLVPLEQGRRRIEALLTPEASLARYEGEATPCGSALEAASGILEEGYREGAPQVLFLLTDGDCNRLPVDVEGFLESLRSHGDGLFQLFLLRFRGRPFDPALEVLAKATEGQVIEVDSADPATLLEPFADALTRSQGYEAELLTPSRNLLAGHRGARSIRLLAVTRGEGQSLGFEIGSGGGRSDQRLEASARGTHHWEDGEVFRYATAEVRPGAGETMIRVTGAGDDWKVVAVPDYRLRVHLEIGQGRCEVRERRRDHIAAGEMLCAVLSVVDHEEQVVVGEWVRAGLDASLQLTHQEPGGAAAEERVIDLTPESHGERAEFFFERPNLEEGVWMLRPRVRLRLAGNKVGRPLPAGIRTVQATSIRVDVEPRSIDFGTLVPGGEASGELLRFTGNFSSTTGRLELLGQGNVPPCVSFGLGEATGREAVGITQGQSLIPRVKTGPYCGPEAFDRSFSVPLRVALDPVDGQNLPSPTLTASLRLVSEIEYPGRQQVRVAAGETREVEVAVASNAARAQELEARVVEPGEGWPDGLVVTVTNPGLLSLDPARSAPGTLGLEIRADACCRSGSFDGHLELAPMGSEPAQPPISIPLSVEVTSRGWWACRGPWILRGLLLAFLLLLLLYLASMVRHSRFLSRDHLAASLVPLRWDPYGAVERDPRSQMEMLAMVRAGMSWHQRAFAWLAANPLVFGLPGRRYRETVELQLQPERQLDRSRVRVVQGREHLEELQRQPGSGTGRLFARATAGRQHIFYSVPMNGTRIGRLVPEQWVDQVLFGDPEEEDLAKARVLTHKRRQRLIHPIPEKEREEGRAAGWQLG